MEEGVHVASKRTERGGGDAEDKERRFYSEQQGPRLRQNTNNK